jgi:[protein-PII] uridylyltransferase
MVGSAQPSSGLLDWLSEVAKPETHWDRLANLSLLRVVQFGNARSWRFLETVGVLDRVLPELAETIRTRLADPFQLDPMNTHRWALLEELGGVVESRPDLAADYGKLAHPEWLLLAALLVEGLQASESPVATARRIVRRLDLGARAEQEIAGLIEDRELLWATAGRADGLDQEGVVQLASHLDTPERARALYLLSLAGGTDRESWEGERLRELHELIQDALANSDLTGLEARNLVGRRKAEAMRLVEQRPDLSARIENAPRAYVLRQDSAAIARQAGLLEPLIASSEARVLITPLGDGPGHWLDVAARDRPGLLAAVTGVLGGLGLNVSQALIATWPDGAALESFLVTGPQPMPEGGDLVHQIEDNLDRPVKADPLPQVVVVFEDRSSPWHTVCEISGSDRPGLIHAFASALAAADIDVQAARVIAAEGVALGEFEVTNRSGAKLTETDKQRVRTFLATGGTSRRRPRLGGWIRLAH